MTWIYDPRTQRYHDDVSKRFLSDARVRDLVQESITAGNQTIAEQLVTMAGNNRLAPRAFNEMMREQIKRSHIQQYIAGRGGLEQMKDEDWGSIGGMLADQYRYLDDFTAELRDLSPAEIAARSAMYIRSSREAFERAKTRAKGLNVAELPRYPADGSNMSCKTNCTCYWSIEDVTASDGRLLGFDCYWKLGGTEQHCSGCLDNAASYSPYEVRL